MPSGEFEANAIHFAIGIMTYNLIIAQKLLTIPEDWKNKTIKSISWLLVEMRGIEPLASALRTPRSPS